MVWELNLYILFTFLSVHPAIFRGVVSRKVPAIWSCQCLLLTMLAAGLILWEAELQTHIQDCCSADCCTELPHPGCAPCIDWAPGRP